MSKHLTKPNEMNRTLALSHAKRSVYKGFFSVEEHDLTYQKFNNEQSNVVTRSTLVSSDAVIVLPYDPINDRILLIEQFRAGPYVKGDENPWVLEPVARSYPSPGISTEFFHQYIGLVSLPEETNLVSGLESEAEDIRSHIFSYEEFYKMIVEGEMNVGPAILLGLWLSKNRKSLIKKYMK